MARDYGAGDVVRLVDALTNMFRIGLSRGRDYISVEQELSYVANYLYIQKIIRIQVYNRAPFQIYTWNTVCCRRKNKGFIKSAV